MATLFDQSGKPVDVPDDQVTHGLISGQYKTDKPTVTVKAGGKTFDVPTQNLGKFAAAQPDAKIVSGAEMEAQAQKKEEAHNQELYGDIGSQAHVALMSGLGGLTLGGSDYLAGKVLTDEQKLRLEREKAASGITNIVAGVGGAILPTLLTGGAAAPEELAALGGREALGAATTGGRVADALSAAKGVITAPTRALEGLSSLAERGAGKLVGTEAESFAGQLAQKAIAKAAGGAVTGAAATGAMDIGENELSTDHNLTGEQLLHHMGMGALFGGGLGLAAGAGGKVLEHALGGAEGSEGGVTDKLKSWMGEKAEERQWFATGAKTPETKALMRQGLSPAEAGRWSLDNLEKYTADGKAPLTREAIGEAATKAVDEIGPKVGNQIGLLDQAGAVPKWEPVLNRLRSEVVEPLTTHIDPAVQGIAKRVGGLIDNAEAKLGEQPSFTELFNLRRDVQDAINFNKADMSQATANSELKKVRSIIEDEIGKQGEHALGPEWKTTYDGVKRDYRMASSVSDAFESADARIQSHNPISLESSIIGASGIAGLAAGHPAALLASGAAAVGRHLLKTYGDAIGSHVLNYLSKSGALQSTIAPALAARSVVAAQRNYTSAMARGLAALTHGEMLAASPGRPKSTDGDFNEKSRTVQGMLATPQQHVQRINNETSALGPSFATVGSSYQRSAMASSLYLAQNLPKAKPVDPLTPKAGMIEPSAQEKAKFNQIFDAVQNPPSLLHDTAKGVLTRDQINAVASTSPSILKDMQAKVTTELKTLKQPLDPAQQACVKMLLGQPVFDHPINPLPPAPPAPPQGQGNKKSKSATSRPLKIDVGSTVGLVGSRSHS